MKLLSNVIAVGFRYKRTFELSLKFFFGHSKPYLERDESQHVRGARSIGPFFCNRTWQMDLRNHQNISVIPRPKPQLLSLAVFFHGAIKSCLGTRVEKILALTPKPQPHQRTLVLNIYLFDRSLILGNI